MSLPNPLITATADRMSGAPVFAGTRVPVQNLFDDLKGGEPLDEFLIDFPVSRGSTRWLCWTTRDQNGRTVGWVSAATTADGAKTVRSARNPTSSPRPRRWVTRGMSATD